MTSKWTWVALGASLMLNLVFIAGVAFGWSHHWGKRGHHGWGQGGENYLAEKLDLNEEQAADLKAMRDRFKANRTQTKQARQEMRKGLLAELAKPTFDRSAAGALLAQSSELRQAGFLTRLEDLHTYMNGLSAEQRETLLTLAEDRRFFRKLMGAGRRHKDRKKH